MMRTAKHFVLILAFSASSLYSFGLTHFNDSLIQLLQTDKSDTIKLSHLNRLTWEYSLSSYDSSLLFANSALELSKLILRETTDPKIIKTTLKGQAGAYFMIGVILYNQGNYPEALKNHFVSLKIYTEIENKSGIASANNNIGNVFNIQKNFPEALKYYLTAIKIQKEIGNKIGLANSYNNIGAIYTYQGNYNEALKNQLIALKLREEIGRPLGIGNSHGNIATIYYAQAVQEKNDKKKSLLFDQALRNYLIGLKIGEEIDDKAGSITCYNGIGNIYMKQKQYVAAEKYLLKAKEISDEIKSIPKLFEVFSSLVELDSATGNYKGAYENHKLYTLYKDSLDNEETRKKTVQSQMTFDFEKKEAISKAEYKGELEKQNILAEEKSRKQKIITWSVLSGLILVLVFASFIFRSLRLTRKQKQTIEIKNKETELQKNIIEEKHKEITDSINYAERIQRSFLASKSILDENLKDYFVFFQPKDVVSGDFYWASKLNNGKFILATADSTGHGVPGAIMSILNISSLEKAVEQDLIDPSEILNQTRKTIIDRLKKDGSKEGGKDGMDCSLISFDFTNQKMTFAAANNPIWVIRNSNENGGSPELLEFKADKMPVGKHDKDSHSFSQHEFQLQKNDIVYTLTDGFPDQFGGEKGKKFMYKQLKELLIEISNLTMSEQKDIIKNKLSAWKGEIEQVDDILLIGVRL